MRHFDQEEADRLNAPLWMLDLLKLNPSYVSWGPHEDYMWNNGDGWNGRQIYETWADFGPWELNDLNEVVNFYFSINRASEDCRACCGNGYHPDGQEIVNSFYSHMNPAGKHWHDDITQDELDALIEAGRIKPPMTVAQVNAMQHGRCLGHDGINRHILTKARLNRFGIPHECPACQGHGYVFTEPDAHTSLTLWVLHPHKGCSRGVEITRIQQEELPAIFEYLRQAADRNAQRFHGIQVSELSA